MKPRVPYRVPCSGLQELGPRAQPATLLRLSVILLFVWFSVRSNIALFKPTSQSSSIEVSYASNAVDGKKDLNYKNCAHTKQESDPWWRVDLGRVEPVAEVNILNRGDCCWGRLNGAEMRVGR